MICLCLLALAQSSAGRIMTFKEYARVHHRVPYVLDVKAGKGKLLYFGIRHTRNPNDAQLPEARKEMLAFKPTIVLNEDISAVPQLSFEVSVKDDGERGALAFWARQDHVPMRSIDLTRSEEIEALVKRFPAEQVKMFYLLRSLNQMLPRRRAEMPGGSWADWVSPDLDELKKQGLSGSPRNVAEIDQAWKRLGIRGDWREANIEWIEPSDAGPLNRISEASSELRDRHMVSMLVKLLDNGERVFAIVGASHVVMQEPALRGLKGANVERILTQDPIK